MGALEGGFHDHTRYQQGLLHELHELIATTEPTQRQLVHDIVAARADHLADLFYATLLKDDNARRFIDNDIVNTRLRASMRNWIIGLTDPATGADEEGFVARQYKIGEVHARIQMPIHLVTKGARVLKRGISAQIRAAADPRLDTATAVPFVNHLIDLAIEMMSTAYLRDIERGARTDEAYRLFSLSQNIGLERERQRAALLEWSNEAMIALSSYTASADFPAIGTSEFGLWLRHKARMMFEGAPELARIEEILAGIDAEIVPALRQPSTPTFDRLQVIRDTQDRVNQLKFLLASMFEHAVELENGRDSLTRVLNRRFLPSVMARELELSKSMGKRFALLMIDIDRFKEVNDRYGHDAGDTVLQAVATTAMNAVRAGDFIFRFGGEEFLIVLVDIDEKIALEVADKVRRRIAEANVTHGGAIIPITVSIGVAVYSGHPDYAYLLNGADSALYAAKNQGRNRCALFTP